ncbi:MAG TPA: DNA polymerase III subunit alpha, partial [Anaerolineae bacterium]
LADIFGRDRFWIELQRHWLPDDARLSTGLVDLAGQLGAGLVATNDVHYATAEGYRLHDILTATRHNLALAELGTRQRFNNEYYLKGEAEMAALFPDQPGALRSTQAIAERCQVSLDFSRPPAGGSPFAPRRLPAFPRQSAAFPYGVPPGETEFDLLYRLCHAGLQARYRPLTPAVLRQLSHELSVIEAAGLAGYFLIVWDIVRFSRSQGIRCQGRGSAANSLVAYLLGITPVDPLAQNLLFERFLSEHSDTMPDIDIDFAADRRDEGIAYVYERYGADHAAMVCNVVTYQWRSAVRDVARAFGYAEEDIGGIEGSSTLAKRLTAGSPVYDFAQQLVDVPRHISVHVGGILITAQPLIEVVPLQPAAKPGIVVAQWNKDSVEDAGLIKIDLLALRTLGMVSEITTLIAQRHATAVDVDALALDDPTVYRLLAEADTIGCFQVESRAQSQMLPRLRPVNFADLTIQVSIVRPGPIQGGMVHPYLRRRAGQEPVTYLDPSLEPVLAETLGVIIFQEQVIRVAVALAGFSPGEADRLRRAMSRSRSGEAMAELQGRFVTGAVARGVPQATAEEAFRQLQGFATYGFCKSHAAAFALVAYQTLWLKAYYPAEFYCALLNQQPMGFYSPEVIVNDAHRHSIATLRPHANLSQDECTLTTGSQPALRLGLRYLTGLGEAGRTRLLAGRGEQPFADLTDFCRRTRLPRPLVADLIRAGALDDLPAGEPATGRDPARRQMLWTLGALHYEEEALLGEPEETIDLPELSDREALAWDYELLGLSPDDHPLRLLRPGLRQRHVLTAAEMAVQPVGKLIRVAGMVVVRQAPPTAKGHLFITLEDETGLINLIIRPDLFAASRGVLDGASLLLVEGTMQRESRATSLLVRRVQRLVEER